MVKAILVEDDCDLRHSIADCLTLAGHSVTGVGNAVELYQALTADRFDVAILDVNLPHYDGFDIASHLAERTTMAIVMTTVRGGIEDRVRGYRSGADLYLVKPVDCDELSAAIEALVHRRRPAAADPAAGAVWRFDRGAFTLIAPGGAVVSLTRREALLVDRLLRAEGAVVARQDLVAALGESAVGPAGSRALDVSISRLRAKVQAGCGVALPLQTIQGAGLAFLGRLVGA